MTRKEIASAKEVVYGFSRYYTVHYTDGTWEHAFYSRKDIEDFLSKARGHGGQELGSYECGHCGNDCSGLCDAPLDARYDA